MLRVSMLPWVMLSSLSVAMFVYAQPPDQAEGTAEAAQPPAVETGETQDEQPQSAEPEEDREQPDRKEPRKSDAIEDIAPETASHVETEPLAVEFQRLTAFQLRDDGCLLACDADAKEVKLIGPDGQQVGSIGVDFSPEALCLDPDGLVYCGGEGQLAVLDLEGNLIHSGQTPDEAETPLAQRRRGKSRPIRVSGIAVSEQDVFVAFGSGWSTGSKSKLYRFDRQLQNPKLLREGLRGCCQRCDILFRDGVLYLAENSAHRVVLCDRTGAILNKWGERRREGLEGFSACCNPMNISFDGDGLLYTSESGLGRVKRYTKDGQFVDLVGYVDTERFQRGSGLAASCSNMTLAVTPNADRIYVMDYRDNRIRVLERKGVVHAAE